MPTLRTPLVLILSAVATAATEVAAQTISRESPFHAPAADAAPAPLELTSYEVVGVMTFGKEKNIGILEKNTQKHYWIPIGRAVGGIEIVSHDAKTDEIVARIHGELRRLRLRAPSAAGAPTTVPGVASTPPPATTAAAQQIPLKPLVTPAEQEREARMLVSDLLEISMRQRKAYEEAQRKKQSEPATPPSPAKN